MPGSLISTGDLRKSFGDVAALDGLDLEIPPGVTGLVGANGAGKTTLIRLLLGLIAPTSGHVSVFGVPVDSDPSGLRERIGYMPEGRCLPGRSNRGRLRGLRRRVGWNPGLRGQTPVI